MKKRGNGLRTWEFRYYEPLPEGTGRTLRAVTVGTLQDYPTEASARKSPGVQAIVLRINAEHTLGPVTASTMAALMLAIGTSPQRGRGLAEAFEVGAEV